MDRFPKKHQLPKLTQEEISKSNFLVSTKENKFAVKNILQRKGQAKMIFLAKLFKLLWEKNIKSVNSTQNLPKKIEEE